MHYFRSIYENFGIVVLSIILIWLTCGCVTIHQGYIYNFSEKQLAVSCGKDLSISHEKIKSVTCAFENTGDSWLEVKVGSFYPNAGQGSESLTVLSPDRVQSFVTAYSFQRKMSEHNTNLVLAGLVIGSAIGSGSSKGIVSTGSSAALVGAVAAGAAIEAANSHYQAMDLRYTYGDGHILGSSFELPPKSFLRKTALIEDANDIWPASIELCIELPEKSCQVLPFWSPRDHQR